MALNPEDLSGGFQHYSVMAFINEKMARHEKGPEFYLENASLSWAEVEDKLRGVLEDSKMPSEAKEACAWSSLALGIRFNHRQGHLHASRVQQLYDFSKPQKSDAQTLASNLSEFKQRQEMNCKEVTYHLRLTQAKLEEVEKERDRLSWKLFWAELGLSEEPEQIEEGQGLVTASATATEAGEEEEKAEAVTTTATTGGAAAGGGRQTDGVGPPSRPAAAFTAASPHSGTSGVKPRSDVGDQGKDPQVPKKQRRRSPKAD